jgi:hypothetical protein
MKEMTSFYLTINVMISDVEEEQLSAFVLTLMAVDCVIGCTVLVIGVVFLSHLRSIFPTAW